MSGHNILLSIVITVFNVDKYIVDCLKTLRPLFDNDKVEIIIVDDCSKDNTKLEINNMIFKNNLDRIYVINSEKNEGPGQSRNKGIEKAAGKYLMFIDGDDLIYEKNLKSIMNFISKSECDIIVSDYFQYYEDSNKTTFVRRGFFADTFKKKKSPDIFKLFFYISYKPMVMFNIYRINFLKNNKLLFLPRVFFEDEEWITKVFLVCNSCEYCKVPWYIYRRREGSITKTPNFKKELDKIFIAKKIKEFCSFTKNKEINNILLYITYRIFKSAKIGLDNYKNRSIAVKNMTNLRNEINISWYLIFYINLKKILIKASNNLLEIFKRCHLSD
jgi:glycosyltransferase involved in cell wall biosynthesis